MDDGSKPKTGCGDARRGRLASGRVPNGDDNATPAEPRLGEDRHAPEDLDAEEPLAASAQVVVNDADDTESGDGERRVEHNAAMSARSADQNVLRL
jgi:hypothetical protein